MRVAATVLLLTWAGASAADVQQQASPGAIQKVLQMMNDMRAKAKKEKTDEQVRFASFEQFCQNQQSQKKSAIAKGSEEVDKAQAAIAEAAADVDRLAKEIQELLANVDQWTADAAKADKIRKESAAEYVRAHEEATASLESTNAALETIQAGSGPVSLSQLTLPKKALRRMESFLQVNPLPTLLQDAAEWGTPEAKAFEGSSGAVVEMVESLADKLKDEKTELEKREMNAQGAYRMQTADLDGQIKQGNMESDFKTSFKQKRAQDQGTAKSDLADASVALAEDQKFLSDLTAECELKTTDFQKRQNMRQGEIEAIEKATEIMSSGAVVGGAQHTALLQKEKGKPVLAQLRHTAAHGVAQSIAARYLAEQAHKTNSRLLSFLATQATADPFSKVIKMVKDMIEKLMEEANEEAEQKAFCDAEMGKNKITRDTKTALIAELKADMEQTSADIKKTAQQIIEINEALVAVDAAIVKSTDERKEEKAKNQITIDDSRTAQAATAQAIQVLKDYYKEAGNQVDLPESEGLIKWDPRAIVILNNAAGGALVQEGQTQQVPGAPEMESGKYTGMENGGIVGMLEIIESDFASVLSETESSEVEAVTLYKKFMTDSDQDKAVKNTELKHKETRKTEKESELSDQKKDLKGAMKELMAAMDYHERLKPSCVDAGVSYEDKVAARKEEIESLQEALKILSQDDIA